MDEQSKWAGGSILKKDDMRASSEIKYEYSAEVWWTGGCNACRKLVLAQIRVGRRLLGESNRVAGVAMQEDLGWRKGGKR